MTVQLDFPFLDDFTLAVARQRISAATHLAAAQVTRLGPFLELFALHRSGLAIFDALTRSPARQTLQRAFAAGRVGRGAYTSAQREHLGFIATCRDPRTEDQAEWVAFCLKGQEAAEFSSLPKPIAQGLIGALREIEDNVHIHSERACDGVVGFRATADEFEFVVADSGIGILKSLRQSPDYTQLNDPGTAIRIALTDGQSRLLHQDPGRGYGFHGLFVGLANLNGELRFRSDDHALTIDGASPSMMIARLSQKVPLQGFVVSVVCRLRPDTTLH